MPDTETPNDNRETLSDREFLHEIAERISGPVNAILAELRAEQEITRKQLDHIDTMLHEVHQFIEEHKPALGRALSFLDPGRSMRDYLKHRPKARSDGQP